MSRYYEMSVEITGYRGEKADAVQDAATAEWPFEDWDETEGRLIASGKASLYGGESEEEFTERLSLAVWRANGAYCEVTVDATYLESLPSETHCLDEDDYVRLIAEREGQHDAHRRSQ